VTTGETDGVVELIERWLDRSADPTPGSSWNRLRIGVADGREVVS